MIAALAAPVPSKSAETAASVAYWTNDYGLEIMPLKFRSLLAGRLVLVDLQEHDVCPGKAPLLERKQPAGLGLWS